jgi:hypothetical protein
VQLPILIEPIEGGRFRARAGEPFALTAEGDSRAEAANQLERLIAERLRGGAQLVTVNVPNGSSSVPAPPHFPADELYKTDWVYRELQEAITENRRLEDEEEQRRIEESAGS